MPPYELPPERVADLEQAKRVLRDAQDLCNRAARAGMDVQAQDQYCTALMARIEAALAEFGPSKRRA